MKYILFIVFCFIGLGAVAAGQTLDCPEVTVYGPNTLTPKGEPMIFSAKVSDNNTKYSLSYEWSTKNIGEIISGQGTPQIRVVSQIEGSNVTATVKIKGLPTKCENTASDTSSVTAKVIVDPFDWSYGDIPWHKERLPIAELLIYLNSHPNLQGLLAINLRKGQSLATEKKHLIKIVKFLRLNDPTFDLSRLWFSVKKAQVRHTKVEIFSKNDALPTFETCTLINAKTLPQ